MLIHNVYFWLRKDLSAADRATFEQGVRALAALPYLERGFAGSPAPTDVRPVIDHSYDYAIALHFKSLADHDFYQKECAEHTRFVSTYKSFWERVQIYDVETLS
ncbi:MAG TPA: Dabb family protein [Chthoniobacterales bacterium]|jgi:hypothetical protein